MSERKGVPTLRRIIQTCAIKMYTSPLEHEKNREPAKLRGNKESIRSCLMIKSTTEIPSDGIGNRANFGGHEKNIGHDLRFSEGFSRASGDG